MWATQHRPGNGYLRFDHHAQNQLHKLEPQLGFAMQEAVVAHTPQACGQNVLQDAPQEIANWQLAISGLFDAGINVSEANDSSFCIKACEIFFANDAAIQIARQVLQRRLAVANIAAVDNPFFGHADRNR